MATGIGRHYWSERIMPLYYASFVLSVSLMHLFSFFWEGGFGGGWFQCDSLIQNWQARGLLRLWYFGMIPVGERSVEIMSTTLFGNSMEQIPSREASRFSASQEVPHILWNPKVHYHIHQSPPTLPVLSQINPNHAPLPHLMSWRSILLLSSHLHLVLPRCLFRSGFRTRIL